MTQPIRIVVSPALEPTIVKVAKLVEQANAGDRRAQKTLDFAKHYGRTPKA